MFTARPADLDCPTTETVIGAMENRHDRRDVDERGLIAGLCVLAYTLAVYALPFMLAVEAARCAYATGSGLIGASLVGLVTGAAAYGLFVFVSASLRSPILRLIVALIFAAPAAMAGYALVYGVTREAVSSEVWRQIFCIIGGGFVGVSALLRLAGGAFTRTE